MAGKFSIYKYVKLAGKGWRYARAAYHPNGKIKPDAVLVKGVDGKDVEEKHPEGSYVLNFKKKWIPVGGDGNPDVHFLYKLKREVKNSGVAHVKPHRFRDTFITNKLRDGVDIRTVQRWAGHDDINVTMSYAPWLDTQSEAARNAAIGKTLATRQAQTATNSFICVYHTVAPRLEEHREQLFA